MSCSCASAVCRAAPPPPGSHPTGGRRPRPPPEPIGQACPHPRGCARAPASRYLQRSPRSSDRPSRVAPRHRRPRLGCHRPRHQRARRPLRACGRAVGARRLAGRGARPPRAWPVRRAPRRRGAPVGAPRPLFLLGHSLGGLIAPVYALRHQEVLAGLILSAPAVMLPERTSPATIRAGRFLARWAANLPVIALRLDAISRDPAVVRAYHEDALVHKCRVRARTGAEILEAIEEVQRDIPQLRLPVLALQGTIDLLVDPGAARWVDGQVGSEDHTLRIYPGLYHEIFNEPEHDAVLDDVAAWLSEHSAA